MINMLRIPMDTVDSMQEQMGNVGKKMEILWKNQKEMLGIKNTVTEIKNGFHGFSRLDPADERISELEDFAIGFLQN